MSRLEADHVGSSNRYAYGCRCVPCTKAATRADAERRLDRMAGRPRSVPAEPVRQHVLALQSGGLSKGQIAAAAGVSETTVAHLSYGFRKWLLRGTAESILGVRGSQPVTRGNVPAVGAVRRIRALYALGHFQYEIASACGLSRDCVSDLAAGSWASLAVERDVSIRRAYDRLGMTVGGSWKTRRRAERKGWAPPLAWDDDTIDDPDAVPQTDAVPPVYTEGADVVDRFLMGESVILDKEGRRKALRYLMEWTSLSAEEIGARLEMSGGFGYEGVGADQGCCAAGGRVGSVAPRIRGTGAREKHRPRRREECSLMTVIQYREEAVPAFKRLTRADLSTLTRAELQDRIEVENAYWDRKCRRGLSEADAAAHREFSAILHAAVDPGASLAHAQHYLETGVDNGYWDEKPGAPRSKP